MATRNYLLPQVIVQQDFASLPASATQSLLAVIVGPRKSVREINDPNDASYVSYGAFNTSANTTYTLKGVSSLDVVEKDSIVLELKNVYAQYASLSGTSNIKWAGNVLELQSDSFIKYSSLSPVINRHSAFKNRDVQIGDGVVVTDGSITVDTRIIGFNREEVAASAGTIVSDESNKTASAVSETVVATQAGTDHTAVADSSAYEAFLGLGAISDTYTVECIVAGVGAAAKFNVSSLLGDNALGVNGVALASPMTIGSRGLKLTISGTTASYALGEKYVITAGQVFTDEQPAIGGSTTAADYSGEIDTVYEVRVVKGGKWSEFPQVAVTTNNGIDAAPPQILSSEVGGKVFFLGSLGLKGTFESSTNDGLLLGDVFYIPMTARSEGAATEALLADPLPVAMSSTITAKFCYSASSITIPRAGYPTTGDIAWTISADGTKVTLDNLVYVTNESFYEDSSALIKMPVLKAEVYYGYKALKTEGANQLNSISEPSLIATQIGKLTPENPVAYGVYKALQNSANASVFYVPVEEDSLQGYINAFDSTTYESAAYYIVPMSNDERIIQAVKAHVLSASDDSKSRERVAVVNQGFSSTSVKYDVMEDGSNWTGYVTVNPAVVGQYDRANVPGATFLTDGIRPGDYFRSNFSIDALGNTVYESVRILSVTDEENLVLEAPAFSVAVGDTTAEIKRRIQVVRVLSKGEQAQEIAANSSALGNRRVINTWPDVLRDGSLTVAGYYGAAAVAGLKSGVAPHQPLTNVILDGFTSADRSTPYFNMDQLNTIAGGGTWIIDQATVGADSMAQIYNRHQLTTDYTDDNMAEISITTNLDSISKILREDLKAFIGQYNNHPYFMQLLKTRLVDRLTFLQGNTITLKAGPQLLGFEIASLSVDPLIRTRVLATINLTLPYPVNVIQIKLNVI